MAALFDRRLLAYLDGGPAGLGTGLGYRSRTLHDVITEYHVELNTVQRELSRCKLVLQGSRCSTRARDNWVNLRTRMGPSQIKDRYSAVAPRKPLVKPDGVEDEDCPTWVQLVDLGGLAESGQYVVRAEWLAQQGPLRTEARSSTPFEEGGSGSGSGFHCDLRQQLRLEALPASSSQEISLEVMLADGGSLRPVGHCILDAADPSSYDVRSLSLVQSDGGTRRTLRLRCRIRRQAELAKHTGQMATFDSSSLLGSARHSVYSAHDTEAGGSTARNAGATAMSVTQDAAAMQHQGDAALTRCRQKDYEGGEDTPAETDQKSEGSESARLDKASQSFESSPNDSPLGAPRQIEPLSMLEAIEDDASSSTSHSSKHFSQGKEDALPSARSGRIFQDGVSQVSSRRTAVHLGEVESGLDY